MAKEKVSQPFVELIETLLSRVDPCAFAPCNRERISGIRAALQEIARQARNIRDLAEKTKNQGLLEILREELKVLPVHD